MLGLLITEFSGDFTHHLDGKCHGSESWEMPWEIEEIPQGRHLKTSFKKKNITWTRFPCLERCYLPPILVCSLKRIEKLKNGKSEAKIGYNILERLVHLLRSCSHVWRWLGTQSSFPGKIARQLDHFPHQMAHLLAPFSKKYFDVSTITPVIFAVNQLSWHKSTLINYDSHIFVLNISHLVGLSHQQKTTGYPWDVTRCHRKERPMTVPRSATALSSCVCWRAARILPCGRGCIFLYMSPDWLTS